MSRWNGQLRPASFRGIQFPTEEVDLSFSQRLAQHKKPNVSGAKVESLGLDPIGFRVKAPFLEGLQHGAGETWQNLFPETFQRVFKALTLDSSVGIFVHPTLGQFNCKPVRGSTITTPMISNGQTLDFELIVANTDQTDNVLSNDEIGLAQTSADQFDQAAAQLNPNPFPPGLKSISIGQLFRQVRALIDQTTLQIQKVTYAVNNAVYQVQQISDSLDRLQSASTAVMHQNLERVKSALYTLRNGLQSRQSHLKVFTTSGITTLAQLAAKLAVTPEQLIQLNPSLSSAIQVPTGTQVIYPAQ